MVAVYLFGSRSLGRQWDRNLGLALLLDPKRHPRPTSRAELAESLAPELGALANETRLDLVVLNDAPPLRGRKIVREGRRLICLDPTIERSFLRDIQVRAVDLEAFLRRPRRPRLEAVSR